MPSTAPDLASVRTFADHATATPRQVLTIAPTASTLAPHYLVQADPNPACSAAIPKDVTFLAE